MDLSTVTLTSLLLWTLGILSVLGYLLGWKTYRSYRLPPGPPAFWPFIGHGFFSISKRYSNISTLEAQYGPILTLWQGSTPSILISGVDVAREALVERGSVIASRPRPPSRAIVTNNYQIINASAYGPYWRNLRRNLVSCVMGSGRRSEIKPARKFVIESLVESLKKEAAENTGVVPVTSSTRTTVLRILLFLCVGKHLNPDLVSEVDETAKMTLHLQGLLRGDHLPFLRFLDKNPMQHRQTYRKKQEQLFGPFIDELREGLSRGMPGTGTYIDGLLRMETEKGDVPTNRGIAALCTEFMNTGTDSTSTCIEWAMANLINHPDVQENIRAEIEELVGRKPLEEDDLGQLPYLKAVIKEALRRHPPAHFTFIHTLSEHCKVAGYDIPANSIVGFHLAAVLRDPNVWENPLEFRPERFLGKQPDIEELNKLNFVPFGAGRRVCPGATLAILHAELIVGRLVQAFQFRVASEGKQEVDMSERWSGGVVGLRTPLYARIQER